jgi:uncharacterized membrane protein
MTPARRAAVYGVAGVTGELAFTGVRGRPSTSLWMVPVYGLAAPLFEPVHDRLRHRGVVARLTAYAVGFSVVEYGSGRILRRVHGAAPWDYSHARLNVHGLVRAAYLPVWAVAGLACERLHDALVSSR